MPEIKLEKRGRDYPYSPNPLYREPKYNAATKQLRSLLEKKYALIDRHKEANSIGRAALKAKIALHQRQIDLFVEKARKQGQEFQSVPWLDSLQNNQKILNITRGWGEEKKVKKMLAREEELKSKGLLRPEEEDELASIRMRKKELTITMRQMLRRLNSQPSLADEELISMAKGDIKKGELADALRHISVYVNGVGSPLDTIANPVDVEHQAIALGVDRLLLTAEEYYGGQQHRYGNILGRYTHHDHKTSVLPPTFQHGRVERFYLRHSGEQFNRFRSDQSIAVHEKAHKELSAAFKQAFKNSGFPWNPPAVHEAFAYFCEFPREALTIIERPVGMDAPHREGFAMAQSAAYLGLSRKEFFDMCVRNLSDDRLRSALRDAINKKKQLEREAKS